MSTIDPSEPPLARCTKCGRRTWDPDNLGGVCGMPQPDGTRCGGDFPPASTPGASA